MDENDLTANTAGTTVMDQNGQKCALIKVETTQKGFTFDAGSLSVVKTEQKTGEIWVYVQSGTKRLTISHPQLGTIRNYDLGQSLERARTYILRLLSEEVYTVVKKTRETQFIVFHLSPRDAVVEIGGERLSTEEGTATKLLPLGTYDYRVEAKDYVAEVGKVTIDDPDNKKALDIKLLHNSSTVKVTTTDNSAEIWVNGELKGKGSWTGILMAGPYSFETRKAHHKTVTLQKTITASAKPTVINIGAPVAIWGSADIRSTPGQAEVTIDGKGMGVTPLSVKDLLIGNHQVIIRKEGFNTTSGTLTIEEGKTTVYTATLEKYATLDIKVGGMTFSMIKVDGGNYTMGTANDDKGANYNERPAHLVTLSSYHIAETEVTQELWQAVMGDNPSFFEGSNLPVEQVSWDDCHTFINKLNQLTGRQFRLPTEAEWEYAARGGKWSNGYLFSGSNNVTEVAWMWENEDTETTHQVKTKKPNELGIYDMSGNVSEWCEDWYNLYPKNENVKDPIGPDSGTTRVVRGGNWSTSDKRGCSVTARTNAWGKEQRQTIGMRLAL
jgi:formylglycine-generating enzyme required for sulfatase activity